MEPLDFSQLSQHQWDLNVRDETGTFEELTRTLMVKYAGLLGVEIPSDECFDRFENLLVGIINENAKLKALLLELNFASVEPMDAETLLTEGVVPNDEIMDKLANIRGEFDEAAELYAEQLRNTDVTLVAPVGETLPNAELEDAALQRIARYVTCSVLVDDRELD